MRLTREHISHLNGETMKSIQIRNFKDKMRRWDPGRQVRLKTVHVDDIPLRLEIYPNGFSPQYRGFVSFFIENLSDTDIDIDYYLKIKHFAYEGDGESIEAGAKSGDLSYLPFKHDVLLCKGTHEIDAVENSDEALEIQWTIKRIWKPGDRDNGSDTSMSETDESSLGDINTLDEDCGECVLKDFDNYVIRVKAQESYTKLAEKYDILAKKLENIETEMNKEKKFPAHEKHDILANKIEKIEVLMRKDGKRIEKIEVVMMKDVKKIRLPECPVCFHDMGPDVKIAQCPSGHLLCWTCEEKLPSPQCPTCQEPVNNRAHGMESYIKTLVQSSL